MGQQDRGRFIDRPKPWLNPPVPGPTVVIDIDGPLANMDAFAYLIEAPKYSDRDWKKFHQSFGDAALHRPGGRIVRELVDAGYNIGYTTTRLDTFMPATDHWLRQKSLPPGHIECRSLWVDGTIRPAYDIKRRHWWRWHDKYQAQSPVVAWIDDEPDAVAMLLEQGCPAWEFDRIVEAHRSGELLTLIEAGPLPAEDLVAQQDSARPAFDEAEAAFSVNHKKWQDAHAARMKQRAQERRQGRRRGAPPKADPSASPMPLFSDRPEPPEGTSSE